MRSLADVRAVFEVKAEGFTDYEVALQTGVPINHDSRLAKPRTPVVRAAGDSP
jgi:hypothetical protein